MLLPNQLRISLQLITHLLPQRTCAVKKSPDGVESALQLFTPKAHSLLLFFFFSNRLFYENPAKGGRKESQFGRGIHVVGVCISRWGQYHQAPVMVLLRLHADGPEVERTGSEMPRQHRTVHNLWANASHRSPC